MVMGYIYKKNTFMKDIGRIIWKFMEFRLINLVIIKEILRIIKNKGKVSSNGQINSIIMDNGRMGKNMEMVFGHHQMGIIM